MEYQHQGLDEAFHYPLFSAIFQRRSRRISMGIYLLPSLRSKVLRVMRIVIIGATGMIGHQKAIAAQLQGHELSSIGQHPTSILWMISFFPARSAIALWGTCSLNRERALYE